MHMASESHSDYSISGMAGSNQTTITGTFVMPKVARQYWSNMAGDELADFRFDHLSTDELYGSTYDMGLFTEQAACVSSAPHSTSKASYDHLVCSWYRACGLSVIVTICIKNQGPYPRSEKPLPLMILNVLKGKSLIIYLQVQDYDRSLCELVAEGRVEVIYNIGAHNEKTNLEVVNTICAILDVTRPIHIANIGLYEDLITYDQERPGHDHGNAIDNSKLQTKPGWIPREAFETGIRKTDNWRQENTEWIGRVSLFDLRNWMDANYGKREVL